MTDKSVTYSICHTGEPTLPFYDWLVGYFGLTLEVPEKKIAKFANSVDLSKPKISKVDIFIMFFVRFCDLVSSKSCVGFGLYLA